MNRELVPTIASSRGNGSSIKMGNGGTTTNQYLLRTFGFDTTQRVVIQSLCRLSANRSRTYALLQPAEGDMQQASICLVNMSDDEAIAQWREVAAEKDDLPLVLVAEEAPEDISGDTVYHCSPKRLSSSLLSVLDNIVTKHYGPSSYRDIGMDTDVPDLVFPSRVNGTCVARALVVDDSEAVCAQMQTLLQRQSIDVEVCDDAASAFKALETKTYDVIFLDVVLPDMEGFKACKRIKSDEHTRNIPVIMLTGKGSSFNRVQGRMAGCDRYLIKPASEQQVVEALRTCIGLPT